MIVLRMIAKPLRCIRSKAASHTPHGYIQVASSDAQELIWDYIHDGKLESITAHEQWESREEYRLEFPVHVFRQKVADSILVSFSAIALVSTGFLVVTMEPFTIKP
jgi:hypothetical protein